MASTVFAAGLAAFAPNPVLAQAVAEQQAKVLDYEIPTQDLTAALRQFAEVSKLQLVYDAKITGAKQSGALSGRMSEADALAQLLAGSGLTYQFASDGAVIIAPAAQKGVHALGPVRVEGSQASSGAEASAGFNGVNGVNGSSDITATEGTHSYTSGALTIGTKTPTSIKDTPLSVSIITAQRIEDQNLNDLNTALMAAPGVTVIPINGNLQNSYYSRGFAITSYQIDGGAPVDFTQTNFFTPQLDMSEFDNLQLLRGADGLYNGYGEPGGVLNLTRKKPLDHAQLTTDTEIGSWNKYREVIDATTPLAFDGKLKGRAVASYEDTGYFYKIAHNKALHLYGVLEADLTPTTILTAGASLDRQDSVPWNDGLPRYTTGGSLNLPQSTCLCFAWNRQNLTTPEIFTTLEGEVAKNWTAKLSLTATGQTNYNKSGYVEFAADPVTLAGPTLQTTYNRLSNRQYLADFTLNGSFSLFGNKQYVIFGTNYQYVDAGNSKGYAAPLSETALSPSGVLGIPVDVFNFNPNSPAYAEPADTNLLQFYPKLTSEQFGGFFDLKMNPIKPLHINFGVRFSGYSSNQTEEFLSPDPSYGLPVGALLGPPAVSKYSSHEFSWPPNLSASYDVLSTVSAYISYSDVYVSQAQYLEVDQKTHVGPVTGSNGEVGLKWQKKDGTANASIAVYNIDENNLAINDGPQIFEPNGDYCCFTTNNDHQSKISQGVDLEFSGQVVRGWQLSASYTYNKNEFKGYEPFLNGTSLVTEQPVNLLKIWSDYKFQQGDLLRRLSFGGGVEVHSAAYNIGQSCTSSTYTTDPLTGAINGSCNNYVNFSFTQKEYAVLSLRAAYEINKTWSASVNINNITNTRYYTATQGTDSGNWYGDPLNVVFNIRSRW
jgi:TonB-dependent siderophore receptor